jgi:hypothetical protein
VPPSATPTPLLVEAVDCADVESFLTATRPARLVAAGGPQAVAAPSPTPLPSNATPPPLGQFILSSSPVAAYQRAGYAGFLVTSQDFGPPYAGQTPELARQTGVRWGYDRTWTADSGAGGFQNYVYEFASPAGAMAYDEGAARGACLNGGTLFEVPGLSGAIGQRFPGGFPDYALRVSFLRGNRRYVVLLSTLSQRPAEEIFQAARIAAAAAR